MISKMIWKEWERQYAEPKGVGLIALVDGAEAVVSSRVKG